MTYEEQKILGQFLRLALPRFTRAPCLNAFDFLSSFKKRLHYLGLVESHGINYSTFQFDQAIDSGGVDIVILG